MWGTSEIIAVTSVAPLRRCPTSPESVPHFSGIRKKRCLAQIRRVLRHAPGVVFPVVSQDNPAHMGPPRVIPRGVGSAGLIGFLVMNPMRGHPENRTPLRASKSHKSPGNIPGQRHLTDACAGDGIPY